MLPNFIIHYHFKIAYFHNIVNVMLYISGQKYKLVHIFVVGQLISTLVLRINLCIVVVTS